MCVASDILLYSASFEEAWFVIKFERFMRLIELINYLRSSVYAGVLCLRRMTKRISNSSAEILSRRQRISAHLYFLPAQPRFLYEHPRLEGV